MRAQMVLAGATLALIPGTGCISEHQAASAGPESCNPSYARDVGGHTDGTAPEVRGSMPSGQLWATFGMPDYPGVPRGSRWADKHRAIFVYIRGKPIKIGFLVTGSGPLRLVARSPDGGVVKPRWGPQAHSPIRGSHRPGDPWGAGFVFSKRGCWRIDVQRGREHGRIVFLIRS